MWDTDNKSNYEGLFAQTPDRSQETIWGREERHSNPFGSDTVVTKGWYGQVQSVEESSWWGNS
jgi:hypothetical protein